MKKRLISLALCLTVNIALFAQSSDVSLYAELTQAYKGAAYPTVIQCAVKMQTLFPHSIYLAKAYAYKGEAQYRLGRYDEALESAAEALRTGARDSEAKTAASYWQGRAYEAKEAFDEAQGSYLAAIDVTPSASDRRSVRLVNLAYYRSGELYYKRGDFASSIKPYDYIIFNGRNFTHSEYEEVSLHLSDAYIKSGNPRGQIDLYQKLLAAGAKENFSKNNFDLLTLYLGQAYESTGEFRKAYEIYIQVLNDADSVLASQALKKAYNVASDHQQQVGEEPGAVLSSARENLVQYPELLAEVWTRLGIDSFNAGANQKALSYFDNGEKEGNFNFLAVTGLYRAEIAGQKDAVSILNDYSEKYSVNEKSQYYIPYCAAFTKWYALQQEYAIACDYGKIAVEKGEGFLSPAQKKEVVYYYALSLYKNNSVNEAQKLLSKQNMSFSRGESDSLYQTQMLYARILAETNHLNDALLIYESALKKNLLKKENMYDYAVLLYRCGYYSSAFKVAEEINSLDSSYIAGLSSIKRKDWKNAERYLIQYNQKKTNPYSLYYAAYAQYRLQQNQSALNSFTAFTERYPDNPLVFNAYINGAHSALALGNYAQGEAMAEKAYACQKNDSQFQSSVILLALIYSEEKKYDQALKLLEPSSSRNDSFGVTVRFEMGNIYARTGKLDAADGKYMEIMNSFPNSPLADDAAYRRGEIYYSAQKYSEAVSRYQLYLEKIKNGKYQDGASFYLADSYARSAQANKAIMQYMVFLESYPESTYCYTAKKNLILLYKESGDYDSALALARQIVEEYSDSQEKEINKEQVETLTHLAAGEDADLYALQSSYEKLGGKKTSAGRVKGTELAEAMWKSVGTQARGLALARELYAVQTQSQNLESESQYAARTALILAQNARQNGQQKEAAAYYLERARFCRMAGLGESAAQSLYGAVEAFDAGNFYQDAKTTYETLLELYPDSSYTKSAEIIIKN